MDVFQRKVQESVVVQSTKWTSRSSSLSTGIAERPAPVPVKGDLPAGQELAAETENFSLPRPFIGRQRKVWPRLEVGLHQKIWIKGVPSPFQII